MEYSRSNVNSFFPSKGFFNWIDGIVKFDIHDSSVSSTRNQFGRCIKTLSSTTFTITKCQSKQVKIKVGVF